MFIMTVRNIYLFFAFLFVMSFNSVFAVNLTVKIKNEIAGLEKCMDLASDNINVVFNTCSNASSQKWLIDTVSGNYNTIKNSNLSNNMCLFSSLNGQVINMQVCESGTYNSQYFWELVINDINHYSIRNKVQRDYGRSGWLSVNSENVLVLNSDSAAMGKWRLINTLLNPVTTIMNSLAGKNKCMDLDNSKIKIVFNSCNQSETQKWNMTPNGSYWTIKNSTLSDNICLFSSLTGNSIDMRICDSGNYTSQTLWSFVSRGTKNFSIISKVQKDFSRNGELSLDEKNSLILNNNAASVGNWYFDNFSGTRSMKGVYSVLLLNTHFTGVMQTSTDNIRKALFGGNEPYTSLSEYLTLASRGAFKIVEGKTLDNIDIGSPGDSCDSAAYRKKAIEMAAVRGVNADDYDLVYVEHSANNQCGYAAVATYPTDPTSPGRYITSNASGHKYWVWTHEFGHTLGFRHSNILVNCPEMASGTQIDGTCERGGVDGGTNDLSDTMGGGGGRMYPVNYMHEVGWLTDEKFPIVGNGTYNIAPLLNDSAGIQGLRIERKNSSFPYLTLEFRQANGFDSNWPAGSRFTNGVIIRQINPQILTSYNEIINTVAGSNNREYPPLLSGEKLYDSYSGKLITVNSVSPNGAVVTIEDNNIFTLPNWSASDSYVPVCQKIQYAGHTWVNGWPTIGVIPGSDGEWGVWRKISSDNFFYECLANFNPNDTTN